MAKWRFSLVVMMVEVDDVRWGGVDGLALWSLVSSSEAATSVMPIFWVWAIRNQWLWAHLSPSMLRESRERSIKWPFNYMPENFFCYVCLLFSSCLTFVFFILVKFTSDTTTSLLHLTVEKLAENGITLCTFLQTAQRDLLFSVTFPVVSLLIIIFLTFTPNSVLTPSLFSKLLVSISGPQVTQ